MTLHERFKIIAQTGKGTYAVPSNVAKQSMIYNLNSRYLASSLKAIPGDNPDSFDVVCKFCHS